MSSKKDDKKTSSATKSNVPEYDTWLANNPDEAVMRYDTPIAPTGALGTPTGQRTPTTMNAGGYTAAGATSAPGTAWQWQGSPEVQQMGGQMQSLLSGDNSLLKGPQNAFNANQMAGFKTRAIGRIGQDNRNFTQGVATANAGRGVAGGSLGSLMQSQLDSARQNSLANAELDTELAGRQQGLSDYNARGSTFNNLGTLYNAEQGRNFTAQQTERASRQGEADTAASMMSQAKQAVDQLRQQYLEQLSTKASGNEKNHELLYQMRSQFENAQRSYQTWLARYNQYAGGSGLTPYNDSMSSRYTVQGEMSPRGRTEEDQANPNINYMYGR